MHQPKPHDSYYHREYRKPDDNIRYINFPQAKPRQSWGDILNITLVIFWIAAGFMTIGYWITNW